MKKNGLARCTVFCLAAGLAVSQSGIVFAAGTETVLAGVGSFTAAETSQEAAGENAEAETADDSEVYGDEASDDTYEETSYEEETWEVPDRSVIGTVGFAQVDEYLNVRASGDTDSEVVGKIYNNGSAEIIDLDDNGWFYVRSGNVEGYVASQFLATGSAATEIAAGSGYTTASTGADVLNVRAAASTDSEIVGTVSADDSVEVVEDNGDWVKVVLGDGTYGYVSGEFVDTTTTYATGETVEEEQARLDAEWLAYLESQAAQQTYYETYDTGYDGGSADYGYDNYGYESYGGASGEYSYDDSFNYGWNTEADYGYYGGEAYSYDDGTYYDDGSSYDDGSAYYEAQAAADEAAWAAQEQAQAAWDAQAAADAAASYTSDAQGQAEYLYQVYLDAQAAADEAAASGSEDLIYQTAAAAQEAWGAYCNAQAEADAAAQAEADAAWAAEEAASSQAQAEQQAQEAQQQADDAYTDYETGMDTGYEDAVYQDDVYDDGTGETYDDGYTESQESSQAASYSSVGADIAAYACQFVGNPYVWGGSSLTNGADCSGFVMSVYANYGISLPHSAAAQSGYGTPVSLDSLQPGDLLFYGDGEIGHVTMYIGNGQVVHASSSTTGIIISDVGYRQAVCARRLV